MKALIMMLLLLTSAAAASENDDNTPFAESAVRLAVRSMARDPGSVEFGQIDTFVTKTGSHIACGTVNAKSIFGDYSGFKRFVSAGMPETTFVEGGSPGFAIAWAFCGLREAGIAPVGVERSRYFADRKTSIDLADCRIANKLQPKHEAAKFTVERTNPAQRPEGDRDPVVICGNADIHPSNLEESSRNPNIYSSLPNNHQG